MNLFRSIVCEIPKVVFVNLFASVLMIFAPIIVQALFNESRIPNWVGMAIQIYGGATLAVCVLIISAFVVVRVRRQKHSIS